MLIHRASPHRWGPGKTHFVDPNGEDDLDQVKTLCRRVIGSIPGKPDFGKVTDVDCQGCLKVMRLRIAEAPGRQVRRMRLLHIDIETRAKLSLKTVGVDVYAPSCEILLFGWAYDNGPVQVVASVADIPKHVLADLTNPEVIKVAWNVRFERVVILEQLGIAVPIAQWLDPSVLARIAGLSGALKLTSGFLNPKGEAKRKEGSQLIKTFSTQCKDLRNPKYAEAWQRFQDYNRRDVIAERGAHSRLRVFTPSAFERKLWELSETINQRGMPISVEYVRDSAAIVGRERQRLVDELTTLTGLKNVNSRDQLLAWLTERGYPYSSLGNEPTGKRVRMSDAQHRISLGPRTSEVFGFTADSWKDDVLEIKNTVYKGTLRRAKVKTDGSWRTVPVPPDMRIMLQRWIEWSGASGSDLLFPGKDGKSPMWPGVWLQKRVQSVARKLGITTTVTFQVLRRSFATRHRNDLKDAAAVLGHANYATTTANVYAQSVDDRVRTMVEEDERRLGLIELGIKDNVRTDKAQ